jgi:hypothetical protein
MNKEQAIAAGYIVPAFASSSLHDLELLVKPDEDLDEAFLAWDSASAELLRVNGWLFSIELEKLEPIDPAYRLWDELPPFERAMWSGEGNDRKVEPATPGKVRWSPQDEREPPAIGARIYANMNDLGPAIVTHYVTIDGFLGVNAKLEAPPAWHIRQNKGNPNGCLFGPEFQPLDDELAQAKIAELVKRKAAAIEERVQTNGHGRRAGIQERIDRFAELIDALA